jgi:hypothetical protein
VRYTLLLITDGRDDYLTRTLCSAMVNLPRPEEVVLVDDRAHLLGFAGAIQSGWDRILETDAKWIFHLEADFTFNEPVNLEGMAELAANEHVAQVALKRQPWSPHEIDAGGIIETDPDAYEEGRFNSDKRFGHRYTYTAHRKFFTTNPCLYRRDIAERGWPQEAESEGKFGIRLFQDPAIVSTFWGGKADPPKVHHIGDTRAGRGY